MGKTPSKFTKEIKDKLKAQLPFDDTRDFDEAKRGFIAQPSFTKINPEAGHTACDIESYGWLLNDQDFESINPSLQRQARLNMGYGLYEVVPNHIYQVRGFDLANITFIKGNKRYHDLDHLLSKKTIKADLVNLRNDPPKGVILHLWVNPTFSASA